MDTRVGAFESPMSQHSQEFLFVLIAPLENFSQPLEVEIFCHFEDHKNFLGSQNIYPEIHDPS